MKYTHFMFLLSSIYFFNSPLTALPFNPFAHRNTPEEQREITPPDNDQLSKAVIVGGCVIAGALFLKLILGSNSDNTITLYSDELNTFDDVEASIQQAQEATKENPTVIKIVKNKKVATTNSTIVVEIHFNEEEGDDEKAVLERVKKFMRRTYPYHEKTDGEHTNSEEPTPSTTPISGDTPSTSNQPLPMANHQPSGEGESLGNQPPTPTAPSKDVNPLPAQPLGKPTLTQAYATARLSQSHLNQPKQS